MTDALKVDEKALAALLEQLRAWASALGFSQIGVADVDLSSAEEGLMAWLRNGFSWRHALHGAPRPQARASGRVGAGTLRVITRAWITCRATPPKAGKPSNGIG